MSDHTGTFFLPYRSCSKVQETTCLTEVRAQDDFVLLSESPPLFDVLPSCSIEFQDLLLLTNSTETDHVDEGDKWLSYDDFLGLVAYRLYDESSKEELLKAFNAFDETSDGFLQESEIREVQYL